MATNVLIRATQTPNMPGSIAHLYWATSTYVLNNGESVYRAWHISAPSLCGTAGIEHIPFALASKETRNCSRCEARLVGREKGAKCRTGVI